MRSMPGASVAIGVPGANNTNWYWSNSGWLYEWGNDLHDQTPLPSVRCLPSAYYACALAHAHAAEEIVSRYAVDDDFNRGQGGCGAGVVPNTEVRFFEKKSAS